MSGRLVGGCGGGRVEMEEGEGVEEEVGGGGRGGGGGGAVR